MSGITENQRRVIRGQLGREPRCLLEVSAECRYGYPVVLKTAPLIVHDNNEFEVFPTLYWLSCPRRKEKVSRIEARGYIEELEAELASNPELKKQYLKNEKNYLEEQSKLLTKKEIEFLEKKGAREALTRGIGGIESDKHIKCLHLHLAHEIADENVLGGTLQGRFKFTDCPPDNVRCEEFI
ncbi:DUF501 domain-containing protein [Candidatus Bipolaricaulota bacterium]|nr:DUF501 domain-containing protein [Candidatus Bipolaricaulota bacterium]MBS3814628.1 DUF501 domain-containing protein [Candidatus Bipolaricaulota bacterium]MBS3825638.1 DUF501 domain-containing protein [Candidatus Bipolaricaulota bacterium]